MSHKRVASLPVLFTALVACAAAVQPAAGSEDGLAKREDGGLDAREANVPAPELLDDDSSFLSKVARNVEALAEPVLEARARKNKAKAKATKPKATKPAAAAKATKAAPAAATKKTQATAAKPTTAVTKTSTSSTASVTSKPVTSSSAAKAVAGSKTTKSSTKSKTSKKTSASSTPTGTPQRLTPKCGAKNCGEGKCKTALQPQTRDLDERAPHGASLIARSQLGQVFNKRWVNEPADVGKYIVETSDLKQENDTWAWNTVPTSQNFDSKYTDDEATAEVIEYEKHLPKIPSKYKNKEAFNVISGPSTGCTSVFLWSSKALFVAHYWEVTAFEEDKDSSRKANFQEQVLDSLNNGREVDGKSVHANLSNNVDLFQENPRARIMTPFKNKSNKELRYPTQIKQLEDELKKLIGNLELETNGFLTVDNGEYTEGDMTKEVGGKKQPKSSSKNKAGKTLAKGQLFFNELVNDPDENTGAGWTMFQYNKNQGVRVIQEDKILWPNKNEESADA